MKTNKKKKALAPVWLVIDRAINNEYDAVPADGSGGEIAGYWREVMRVTSSDNIAHIIRANDSILAASAYTTKSEAEEEARDLNWITRAEIEARRNKTADSMA